MQKNNHPKLAVLFMPHPDDEAVFCGGLMQRLARAGWRVVVVTFTQGEQSSKRRGENHQLSLAQIRVQELKRACQVLKVNQVVSLNFPDGRLADFAETLRQVVINIWHQLQPQLVVTLEPQGVYGHSDHIALSRAVTDAVGEKNAALLFATAPPKMKIPQHLIDFVGFEARPLPPDLTLSLSLTETMTKIESLSMHRSQFSFITAVGLFIKGMVKKEHFVVWQKHLAVRNACLYFIHSFHK